MANITSAADFIAIWTELDTAYYELFNSGGGAAVSGGYTDATPFTLVVDLTQTAAASPAMAALAAFAESAATRGEVALAINTAFVEMANEYVEFIKTNPAIMDIAKDRGGAPNPGQSYHDNILGNINDSVINARYVTATGSVDIPGYGTNLPEAEPRSVDAQSYGSRPEYSGYESDAADLVATQNYDRAAGIGTDGDDTFVADAGSDTINAFDGSDTYDMSAATSGAYADLNSGIAHSTETGIDFISDFENVIGSTGDDTFFGNEEENTFTATTGNDEVDGRDGNDTYDASAATDDMLVDLGSGTVFGALAAELTSIENVKTGSGDDIIIGSSGDNGIDGGAGVDLAVANVSYDDATITESNGTFTVSSTATGSDDLTNVESVMFSDAEVWLVTDSAELTYALANAGEGAIIKLADGTYEGNFTIATDGLTIESANGVAGDVSIKGNFKSLNSIDDSTQLDDWLEGVAAYNGATGAGFVVSADDVSISNITITEYRTGIDLQSNDGLNIDGVIFDELLHGIYKENGAAEVTGFSLTNSAFTHSYHGLITNAAVGAGAFDGVTISNVLFEHLNEKGIYVEQLSNAELSFLTMNDVGQYGRADPFGNIGESGTGIDINLKFGDYSNISIHDFTFTDVGISDGAGLPHFNGSAIAVKARDDGGTYGPNPATLDGVTISDGTIDGNSTGIRLGEPNITTAGPSNVSIENVTNTSTAVDAWAYDNQTDTPLDVTLTGNGDVATTDPASTGVVNYEGGEGVDELTGGATGETFQGGAGDDIIEGDGGLDTAVYDGPMSDYEFGNGSLTVKDNNSVGGDEGTDTLTGIEQLQFGEGVTATTVLVVGAGSEFTTIQAAINAASVGDTILVTAGTYNESVNVNKSVTIMGVGDGDDPLVDTILLGGGKTAPGNGSGTIFNINADNVSLQNLRMADADRGVQLNSGFADLVIDGATIINTDIGIRSASSTQFDGINITNTTFEGNDYGMYNANDGNSSVIENVLFNHVTFTDNLNAAIYSETMQTGNFTNITATNNGTGSANGTIFDFWSAYEDTTFSNIFFNLFTIDNSAGDPAGAAFRFATHGGATDALDITITNGTVDNVARVLRTTEPDTAFTINGVSVLSQDGTFSGPEGIQFEPHVSEIQGEFGDSVLSGDRFSNNDDDVIYGDFYDTLAGDGNDAFFQSHGATELDAGNDTLSGGGGNDILIGGGGDDTLLGGDGEDVLHGGEGADDMSGGEGDDTYFVDDAGDTVTEAVNEGVDTVITSVDHILSDNVENLTLFEAISDTQDFENFAEGPITTGENGWRSNGGNDQEVVELEDGNMVFRMSSNPTTGDFSGPYSPELGFTAGEPQTTADGDVHILKFRVKPVNGDDNSRMEVDFGRVGADDRNNFMVIESIAGEGVRIAVSDPLLNDANGWFDTGNGTYDVYDAFSGNITIAEGLPADTWMNIELHLTYKDGADNDVIDIYLDGQHIGSSTTFENYRDTLGGTHEDNAEANQTDSIFFRASAGPDGAAAPQDDENQNQGFYFDDITNAITTHANGTGNDLDNVITGNSANNVLSGLDGDDTLIGGGGNDTLVGGNGDDEIDGGDGYDTAVFSGSIGDYTFSGGSLQITDNQDSDGDDGVDTLTGIEELQFDGGGTALVVGAGSQFTSIQEAINAAGAGDTIIVMDGTYNENLTIGKAINIVGVGDVTVNVTAGNAVSLGVGVNGAVSIDGIDFAGNGTASRGIDVAQGAGITSLDLSNGEIVGFTDRGIASTNGNIEDSTLGALNIAQFLFSLNGNGGGNTAHIKLFGFDGSVDLNEVDFIGAADQTATANRPDSAIEITGVTGHPVPANAPAAVVVMFNVTVTGEYHKNPVAIFHISDTSGVSITNLDLSQAESTWALFNIEGNMVELDASGFDIIFPNDANVHTELQGEEDGQAPVDTIITGTSGNDSLHGKTGNDTLNGGDGNDILYGGNKPGGDFDDGPGDDTLNGDGGDDQLFGGIGNDILSGGADDDELNGGDNDDTLNGGTGSNQINGDDGIDTVVLDGNFADYTITGAGGIFVVGHATGTDGLTGIEQFTVNGQTADALLFLSNIGPAIDSVLEAGSGDTDIFVDENTAADTVVANVSASDPQEIYGDTLTYALQTIAGQPYVGPFSVNSDGEITVSGDLDFEAVTSHELKVVVTDSKGNVATQDITIGVNDLDDLINVPLDASRQFEGGSTQTPLNLTAADTPGDTPVYTVFSLPTDGTVFLDGVAVTLNQELSEEEFLALSYSSPNSADVEGLVFSVSDETAAEPVSLNVTLNTTAPVNATYNGTAGDDRLDGAGGKDKVKGFAGDDVLFGGNGKDKIFGGADDDRIIGGKGKDKLKGQGGNDTFVFDAGDGRDKILGFQNGSDVLDLTAFGFADFGEAKSNFFEVGGRNNNKVGFQDQGTTIIIKGIDLKNVSADDVLI